MQNRIFFVYLLCNKKRDIMNNKVMIDNQSGFPMALVMTYLAGFTTALNGCIEVTTVKGKYYDNVIIKQV